VKDKKVQILVA